MFLFLRCCGAENAGFWQRFRQQSMELGMSCGFACTACCFKQTNAAGLISFNLLIQSNQTQPRWGQILPSGRTSPYVGAAWLCNSIEF
jgi:hypothetical protein